MSKRCISKAPVSTSSNTIRRLERQRGIEIAGAHYGDPAQRRRQARLRAEAERIYAAAVPQQYQGAVRYDRFEDGTPYQHLGAPDDAMIISPQLYQAFLRSYEATAAAGGEFLDFDGDVVTRAFIGKWLVVVDYHY